MHKNDLLKFSALQQIHEKVLTKRKISATIKVQRENKTQDRANAREGKGKSVLENNSLIASPRPKVNID